MEKNHLYYWKVIGKNTQGKTNALKGFCFTNAKAIDDAKFSEDFNKIPEKSKYTDKGFTYELKDLKFKNLYITEVRNGKYDKVIKYITTINPLKEFFNR